MRRQFTILFGLITCALCAQETDVRILFPEKPSNHLIGLNTIGLFDQFVGEENQTRERSPYLLTYQGEFGSLLLRAGIGPEYQSEKVVHDGFSNSEETQFFRIDGRIGAGVVVLEDGRWQAALGADAIYGYLRDRKIDDSGFDRITNQTETQSYGGGPFVQIAFRISRRISLSTESTLYWTHGTSEEVELYKNFPDFNTVLSKTTSNGFDLTLPNTLFLRIHF